MQDNAANTERDDLVSAWQQKPVRVIIGSIRILDKKARQKEQLSIIREHSAEQQSVPLDWGDSGEKVFCDGGWLHKTGIWWYSCRDKVVNYSMDYGLGSRHRGEKFDNFLFGKNGRVRQANGAF